jgi:hypothetical protein
MQSVYRFESAGKVFEGGCYSFLTELTDPLYYLKNYESRDGWWVIWDQGDKCVQAQDKT